MATPRKTKKRPRDAGAPPRHNVEQYAAARAQGKTMVESVRLAGYPNDSTENAAYKAARRMEGHAEVQDAIQRHKRDVIVGMAKKDLAGLWPVALHVLETLLHDAKLSDSNKIKAVELMARMTGNYMSDNGTQVNILQIGEQAREELRKLRTDPDVQGAALDELQRMTLTAQAKIVHKPTDGAIPVQAEVAIAEMEKDAANGLV